jgi:hypothetical protein
MSGDNMADVQVYTFLELQKACANRGLHARLHIFEGGETVEVTDLEGKQILRSTAEYGHPASAVDMTAKSLFEKGLLTPFDFPASTR